MKANEFRIGNLAKYKDQFLRIENLVKDEFWAIRRGDSTELIPLADIEPIPLTPEILKKCGFKKFESGNFYHPKTMFELTPKFWLEDSERAVKAEYLHQLQNLYFALTGEELVVKIEGYEKATS
jgi:hypothetical protein